MKKTKFLNSLMDREFDVIVEKKVKNSYIGKADNFADIAVGGRPGTDLATGTLAGGVCLAALFVCFAVAAVLLAGSILGTTGFGAEVLFGSERSKSL